MEEFYGSGIVKEEQIQMEIRLLYGNEIQWAVQTAHEVYEQCVRPYTRNAAEVQQYYDYMNLPNLSQEMLAGIGGKHRNIQFVLVIRFDAASVPCRMSDISRRCM